MTAANYIQTFAQKLLQKFAPIVNEFLVAMAEILLGWETKSIDR